MHNIADKTNPGKPLAVSREWDQNRNKEVVKIVLIAIAIIAVVALFMVITGGHGAGLLGCLCPTMARVAVSIASIAVVILAIYLLGKRNTGSEDETGSMKNLLELLCPKTAFKRSMQDIEMQVIGDSSK